MDSTTNTDLQLIQSKLDMMLLKSDYLIEHGKLETRVSELEKRSIISQQWANDEHAAIRKDLNESFKTLTTLIQTVKDDINLDRSNTFKWAMGLVISFVGGGGLVGAATIIIQALHH